jgi:hypothetical protein
MHARHFEEVAALRGDDLLLEAAAAAVDAQRHLAPGVAEPPDAMEQRGDGPLVTTASTHMALEQQSLSPKKNRELVTSLRESSLPISGPTNA